MMARTDEELVIEIAELKSERTRKHRASGPFRSDVGARLTATLDQAKAMAAGA
jgi:hypothetical protein